MRLRVLAGDMVAAEVVGGSVLPGPFGTFSWERRAITRFPAGTFQRPMLHDGEHEWFVLSTTAGNDADSTVLNRGRGRVRTTGIAAAIG